MIAQTRAKLLRAGRHAFGTKGYAEASMDDFTAEAGLTRGALYHHFAGKTDIFRAVFEDIQVELADRGVRAARRAKGGPWSQLEAACLDLLKATTLDPGIAQIFLIDGFTAFGHAGLRELESSHNMAQMRRAVELSIASGEIARRPVGPLVTFLWGGLCELSISVAASPNPAVAQREASREIKRIFACFAPSPRD